MVNIHAMKIPGRWRDGYALDQHTLSSTYLGDDEFGHPQFDTKRSEIGELLYRLKYRSELSTVSEIVETTASFVAVWKPGADVLVPVPASRTRVLQPVAIIAEALAQTLGLPFLRECVTKTKDAPELKNVFEYGQRIGILADAFAVQRAQIQGRKVLLFDDLFRSGATMNAITVALYDQGVADVFALTLTRTRSRQ